ncbi:recombination regulator RecX [Candidatus Gracilibacteria bacterium]|nr:recombination regulator RecX [Candidatus Gracilibacteria bacterium]
MQSVREYGLKLLAKREHSVAEFSHKLRKKYPANLEEVAEIIKNFKENNWLSEARFCEAFIHDQILNTKSGPRKIVQKLIMKGIVEEFAKEKVAEFFPQKQQLDLVQELAQQKYAQIRQRGKVENEFEIQQKVKQFLIGKGYGFETIKDIF